MDIEKLKKIRLEQDGLSKTLGMDFISTPEPDTCMARMKVDGRNRQVFGFLSGGASLALAENLAGIGSMALCPGKICVGINVNGNHVKSVLEGDTVTALGHIIHKGKTLHVWHIELTNGAGELISCVEVTNFIMNARTK
ncbi:MAG: PaaI family thioesterase [Prevotella sp.]